HTRRRLHVSRPSLGSSLLATGATRRIVVARRLLVLDLAVAVDRSPLVFLGILCTRGAPLVERRRFEVWRKKRKSAFTLFFNSLCFS
ncbi:hypothetical protein S245_013329, partial [Arachis hypogaea]